MARRSRIGARRPGAAEWVLPLDPAADTIVASIPRVERQTWDGQSQVADPKVVASARERFFAG